MFYQTLLNQSKKCYSVSGIFKPSKCFQNTRFTLETNGPPFFFFFPGTGVYVNKCLLVSNRQDLKMFGAHTLIILNTVAPFITWTILRPGVLNGAILIFRAYEPLTRFFSSRGFRFLEKKMKTTCTRKCNWYVRTSVKVSRNHSINYQAVTRERIFSHIWR